MNIHLQYDVFRRSYPIHVFDLRCTLFAHLRVCMFRLFVCSHADLFTTGYAARHSKSDMVVAMKASNRWLGLLGAVIFLSAAHVSAYSSSSECYEGNYGDGDCDMNNNRAECGTIYHL